MIEFIKLYFTDAHFFAISTVCIMILGVTFYALYKIMWED